MVVTTHQSSPKIVLNIIYDKELLPPPQVLYRNKADILKT